MLALRPLETPRLTPVRWGLALTLTALAGTWLHAPAEAPDAPTAPSCVGCHAGLPETPGPEAVPFHPQGGPR